MRKIKIIADSCADLSKEMLEAYDVDYVKMSTFRDGVEYPALTTWTDDEVHSFYDFMRNGGRVTTAQVSIEEFTNVFTKYINEGYDIIYIGCSLRQSSSVNTGTVVAKKLMEENEGVKIECIDSRNSSLGIARLVIEASNMVKEGKSVEEITERIVYLRQRINQFVTVHSLTTLKRAGRVKGPAAFFGNLLGVKPILISDADGEQTAYKKVKGRQNSFAEIVSLMKEAMKNTPDETLYLVHADCSKEEIETLYNMAKEQIKCKEIVIGYIGPIIGGSVGPDTVGFYALGEEVTFRVGDVK